MLQNKKHLSTNIIIKVSTVATGLKWVDKDWNKCCLNWPKESVCAFLSFCAFPTSLLVITLSLTQRATEDYFHYKKSFLSRT